MPGIPKGERVVPSEPREAPASAHVGGHTGDTVRETVENALSAIAQITY